MSEFTIVLIDDHPLLARALAQELERSGIRAEVLEPSVDVDTIMRSVDQTAPDLAVVDLGLPSPGGGQSLIPPLVSRNIPVVVLTGESEQWQWAQAIHGGAEVVISKAEPLGDIIDVILRVAAGEPVRTAERAELAAGFRDQLRERAAATDALESLSPRERDVLAGLMRGHSVQRLAEQDYVSVQTVRSQVKSILRKLGASSQLEAVAVAHATGWTPGEPPPP